MERYLDDRAAPYTRSSRLETSSGEVTVVADPSQDEAPATSLIHFSGLDVITEPKRWGRERGRTFEFTADGPVDSPRPDADFENAVRIDGKVLVLGCHASLWSNYGHFLVDQLPILAFADRFWSDGYRTIAVLGVPAGLLRERIQEVVSLVSAHPFAVIFPRSPVLQFQDCLVPAGVSRHPRLKTTHLRTAVDRITNRIGFADPSETLLFISRTDANDRFLRNEAELFDNLHIEFGFEFVRSSELGVREAAVRFHDARMVVGVGGASLANMMFCRPGTPVLSIFPQGMNGYWYYDLAQLFRLSYHDFHAMGSVGPWTAKRNAGDFDCEVETVLRVVRTLLT